MNRNESSAALKREQEPVWSVLARRLFYRFLRVSARIAVTVGFGYRIEGRRYLNVQGGGMLLSTHQSMMDPVLVGLMINRRINYLARKTLFKNPAFGFLIRVLDAIEIDRERGGLSGLKEMLKRLHQGELVLLFPEGTRSMDGTIGELKPGFIPIARRSSIPLIPIVVVGAYECMPRGSKWITPNPICVVVGEPIDESKYSAMTDEELMHSLNASLHRLYDRAKFLNSR